MTSDNATEPRCDSCGVPWRDHPGATMLCQENAKLREQVASASKAAKPDDDELITLDWWRDNIASAGGRFRWFDSAKGWFLFCRQDDTVVLCYEDDDTSAEFATYYVTRGQVRRLISAIRGE